MTYCLGLCLDEGLVFASDSRTNAGVDYVTTYSKMHVFQPAPDRLFVILSAGNLATTQEVMNHIQRDIDYPCGGNNLVNARYLFEAAEYVGRVSVQVQREHSAALSQSGVSGETTLLIGGQISGQPHGLMLIYPQETTSPRRRRHLICRSARVSTENRRWTGSSAPGCRWKMAQNSAWCRWSPPPLQYYGRCPVRDRHLSQREPNTGQQMQIRAE